MQKMDSENGKIKVCIFSTVQPPDDVRLFHREAKSLARTGYEVHLVVPCEKSEIKDGIQIHAIKRPKTRITRVLLMPLIAACKAISLKASIYHFHDPELLPIGFLMRWLLRKKIVFDMRKSTARELKAREYLPSWLRNTISRCYKILESICLKGMALIVANDRSTEEYKNCYLVRNFPEIDEPLMANVMDMDKRLKKPLLIYVGTVSISRGAIMYIELADQLVRRGHDFKMMIIGPDHTNCSPVLHSKIKELSLDDRVQITGMMDYNEAMKFASRAAIGFAILKPVPNSLFCLAGKIIEYMMCGVPVLCSKFDHWRSYVEGERTGMMADPNDINEVVNLCEKMLSDRDELAAMGKRGMEAVRNKYNWDTEFKILLKCYDDLLINNRKYSLKF